MKMFIKNLGIETTLEEFVKEWDLDIEEVNEGLDDYGYFGELCSIEKDDDNRIIGNINTDSWEVIGYVNESYNDEYFFVVKDVYDGDDCYTKFYIEEPISDEVSDIYFKGDEYREKTILSEEEISHFHNLVDEGEVESDVSYQEKWFVKKKELIENGWKKTIESFNLYDWDSYKF